MKKYLLIFIILLLPVNSFAKCTDADKIKLHKLASNVTFSYEYVEKNNKVTFNVIVTNLTKDLVLYDISRDREYNLNGEITLRGYTKADNVRFFIFAKNSKCISSALTSNTMSFPDYNPFYKEELCKQASDYIYCRKWINNPYSYNEFKSNLIKYIEANKQEPEIEIINNEYQKGIFDYIGEIYIKYYYYILPAFIIICFIVMYNLNKKNKLV